MYQDPSQQEQEMADKYMDFIEKAEEQDGIRMSWNNFPQNRIEGTRNVVPLAMLYTPLNRRQMPAINYGPVLCQAGACKAVLNPYCRVDYNNRVWSCCFCPQRNALPQSYAGMTEQNKAAELMNDYWAWVF